MERQISYKYGGSRHGVDWCHLIRSIFPEGSKIPIEDLVICMTGLNSLEHELGMFEARCEANAIIDNKMLLLENDDNGNQYVRMLRGTKSTLSRLFRRETIVGRFSSTLLYKYCYGLSFVLRKIDEYPLCLDFPRLALLFLKYGEDSQSLPIYFFGGMKELRVLSLDVPSLPGSLIVLKNLRTLCQKLVKPEDMSAIGELTDLQFLSISTSCLADIPREMEGLGNLRLLDLRKMLLAYIPPGVLSNLLKLEELYLPRNFSRWGCREKEEEDDYVRNDDEQRINATLCEIGALALNVLQVNVPNAIMLPKNSAVFKNIWQFKIRVPSYLNCQPFDKGSVNELQLRGDAFDIAESGICDLMCRAEDFTLTGVRNLSNVNTFMCHVKDSEFPQLKKLIVTECAELECLLDAENWIECGSFWGLKSLHLSMLPNLKEILHGTRTRSHVDWFVNLRQINIRFCHRLNYVFPVSIARRLRRLQIIEILD